MLGEPLLRRLQPPSGTTDPVGQRRAIQLDAVAGEDLALPIERKVIAIFGDQDMSEEASTGEALGDWSFGSRRLMDRAASTAAIARPAKAYNAQTGRDMVEHLAHCLADHMQHAATTRTGIVFYIEPDVFVRQMRRKTRALGARYRFKRFAVVSDGKPSFGPRYVGVQILEELIVIEPLGATAELIAL